MDTLAGLLGYIDSQVSPAKRKLADLLRNPVDSGRQMIGGLLDDTRRLDSMYKTAGDGYRLDAQGSVMGGLPQYKQAQAQQLAGLLNVVPLGPTVYHGTQNPGAIDGLVGRPGGLKMMDGLGPHVGTAEAANERLAKNRGLSPSKAFDKPNEALDGAYVMPFDLDPTKPFVKASGEPFSESQLQAKLADLAVKLGFDKNKTRAYSSAYGAPYEMKQAQKAVRDHLKAQGYDAIPYINSHEARGSTSYVVLDENGLKPLYAK